MFLPSNITGCFNLDLMKSLLFILAIIDIPVILLSLIISVIIYLIYLPIQFITIIYTLFFWVTDIPIAIPPAFIIIDIFTFLLAFIGFPIIFFIGTLQFINDIENKEYRECLYSSFETYIRLMHFLLGGF